MSSSHQRFRDTEVGRITINFERQQTSDESVVYHVVSPDFSADLMTPEVIGILKLWIPDSTFEYKPSDTLRGTFCPPELFDRLSGDASGVYAICKDRGFKYPDRAQLIAKKARELLENNVFPKTTNTGVEQI